MVQWWRTQVQGELQASAEKGKLEHTSWFKHSRLQNQYNKLQKKSWSVLPLCLYNLVVEIRNSLLFQRWTKSPSCVCVCVCTPLCPTLCNPTDCSPPGFSVQGISQVRTLEWVVMPSSRGSSLPKDRTHLSCVYCVAGRFLTAESWGKHSQLPTVCDKHSSNLTKNTILSGRSFSKTLWIPGKDEIKTSFTDLFLFYWKKVSL